MFDLFYLLADDAVAGVTNTDRTVIGILIAGATSLATWLGSKLVPICREILDNQRANTIAFQQFSNSQAVLTYLLQGYFDKYGGKKTKILIVEDSTIDAAIVGQVCLKLARKYALTLVDVPNLANSYEHIPDTKVVVLDVCLPDATEQMIKEYVRFCPCAVVIHSGHDYNKSDFPSAAAVVKKGDSALLLRELEAVITGARVESLSGVEEV